MDIQASSTNSPITNPSGMEESYSESRYCFNLRNSFSERRTFFSRAIVVVHYALKTFGAVATATQSRYSGRVEISSVSSSAPQFGHSGKLPVNRRIASSLSNETCSSQYLHLVGIVFLHPLHSLGVEARKVAPLYASIDSRLSLGEGTLLGVLL